MTHSENINYCQDINFGETFGIDEAKHITTWGYSAPSDYTPKKDHAYQFNRDVLRVLNTWDNQLTKRLSTDGLYIFGPTGCGKTSEIVQYHAYLNRPLHVMTGHKRMMPEDLQGSMQIISGDTVFVQSPLVDAMEFGHAVFITEGDRIPAETNTVLHSILDGYPMVLTRDGGRAVQPREGFRIIYDANTNGAGDTGRFYRTAQLQDLAFMDRFTVLHKPYPEKSFEKAILLEKTSMPEVFLENMIDIANDIRERFLGESDGEAFDITLSTRTLIRWSHYASDMRDAAKHDPILPFTLGIHMALTDRARPEVKDAIDELIQRRMSQSSTEMGGGDHA